MTNARALRGFPRVAMPPENHWQWVSVRMRHAKHPERGAIRCRAVLVNDRYLFTENGLGLCSIHTPNYLLSDMRKLKNKPPKRLRSGPFCTMPLMRFPKFGADRETARV